MPHGGDRILLPGCHNIPHSHSHLLGTLPKKQNTEPTLGSHLPASLMLHWENRTVVPLFRNIRGCVFISSLLTPFFPKPGRSPLSSTLCSSLCCAPWVFCLCHSTLHPLRVLGDSLRMVPWKVGSGGNHCDKKEETENINFSLHLFQYHSSTFMRHITNNPWHSAVPGMESQYFFTK